MTGRWQLKWQFCHKQVSESEGCGLLPDRYRPITGTGWVIGPIRGIGSSYDHGDRLSDWIDQGDRLPVISVGGVIARESNSLLPWLMTYLDSLPWLITDHKCYHEAQWPKLWQYNHHRWFGILHDNFRCVNEKNLLIYRKAFWCLLYDRDQLLNVRVYQVFDWLFFLSRRDK